MTSNYKDRLCLGKKNELVVGADEQCLTVDAQGMTAKPYDEVVVGDGILHTVNRKSRLTCLVTRGC